MSVVGYKVAEAVSAGTVVLKSVVERGSIVRSDAVTALVEGVSMVGSVRLSDAVGVESVIKFGMSVVGYKVVKAVSAGTVVRKSGVEIGSIVRADEVTASVEGVSIVRGVGLSDAVGTDSVIILWMSVVGYKVVEAVSAGTVVLKYDVERGSVVKADKIKASVVGVSMVRGVGLSYAVGAESVIILWMSVVGYKVVEAVSAGTVVLKSVVERGSIVRADEVKALVEGVSMVGAVGLSDAIGVESVIKFDMFVVGYKVVKAVSAGTVVKCVAERGSIVRADEVTASVEGVSIVRGVGLSDAVGADSVIILWMSVVGYKVVEAVSAGTVVLKSFVERDSIVKDDEVTALVEGVSIVKDVGLSDAIGVESVIKFGMSVVGYKVVEAVSAGTVVLKYNVERGSIVKADEVTASVEGVSMVRGVGLSDAVGADSVIILWMSVVGYKVVEAVSAGTVVLKSVVERDSIVKADEVTALVEEVSIVRGVGLSDAVGVESVIILVMSVVGYKVVEAVSAGTVVLKSVVERGSIVRTDEVTASVEGVSIVRGVGLSDAVGADSVIILWISVVGYKVVEAVSAGTVVLKSVVESGSIVRADEVKALVEEVSIV
ncbi:hypothetical protein AB205_0021460 [Aquarana catesbeiana]|uniref:Uncharacterized protein n=1 Tax=Aquarana catesbeiana TaxID=8400 RepID=A0A2G9R9B2_AQUCT|nr:hypothetical protein AB205_0021460 [Aquarana catesbeiana]